MQIDACRVGGVNENIAILLLAAKFGVPVCPHAGGVGLCEMVQHLAMFDYLAVSGTTEGRMIEYVDHLHEHFVDPVRIEAGHYVAPRGTGRRRADPSGVGRRVPVSRRSTVDRVDWFRFRAGGKRWRASASDRRAGGRTAATARSSSRMRSRRLPGPGQVRIDVAYTGICGTDLHILHGAMDHRVTMPAVIGHEMSGRIAEVGPDVADWAIGDPVTVMPLDWCGECPACQRGHSHICQRLNFLGIDSPGSMQSSWTVPSRRAGAAAADLSLRTRRARRADGRRRARRPPGRRGRRRAGRRRRRRPGRHPGRAGRPRRRRRRGGAGARRAPPWQWPPRSA